MTATTYVLRPCLKLAAMSVLLLAPGGCFSYTTVPLETVAPDQQARLVLDQEAFGRVMNQAAMEGFPVQMMNLSGNRISGRVAGVSSDALTIQLRGAGASVLSTQVATAAIQEAAIRQFDRTNTIITVGGSVAAFSLLIQGGVFPGGTQGTGDVDPENMIGLRLFSISVP